MSSLRRNLVLLLPLIALASGCRRAAETATRFDDAPVVIISIDTLRADHLPAYGYKGVETPAIDALRKDAILFSNAYSQVPLTLPSHVSLITGLLPAENKVRDNLGYQLDPKTPTIASMLKERGYETGAAVSAYVLRASTGFGSSFTFFDDGIATRSDVAIGALQRDGRETASIATQWIGQRKEKPFFFLLHLFEPHSPYTPPEPFRSRYTNAYDGEIAATDAIVGEFLETLKRDGIYDKAVIVLLSDHGEGLGDHGEPEHGIFLYRESIHVPLLVKLPRNARAGETIERPAALIDVLPTIAELTGATTPANVQGHSLLAANATPQRVYSETLYPRIHLGWSELRSLTGADYHFIQAPKPELYDVRNDAAEKNNVLADQRRVYASMRDELAKYGTSIELPSNIDAEEAKKLAALGYLASSAPSTNGPLTDPKDGMPELREMMGAMRFGAEGRHEKGVVALRALLAKSPKLTDAWSQLGMSLEALGRYEESAAAYRKAIESAPSMSAETALRLGDVLLRLGRADEAAEHAKLAERVNYGGAHLLLARVALEKNDFATAEHEAQLAARDNHNDIHAKVLLARIYAQQDRAPDALRVAQEVAAEAQKRKVGPVESLFFVTGDALARMQRYDEAIQALEQEIKLFPHNRQAYSSLYLIYVVTNRVPQAEESLERMVRANPNKPSMLFAAKTADTVGDSRAAAMWRRRAEAAR